MSKTTSVLLLLFIVVNSLHHIAASPARARVNAKLMRRCGCRVFRHGVIKCPHPLVPSNHEEEMDLIECICNRTHLHRFPKIEATCTSWHRRFLSTPI